MKVIPTEEIEWETAVANALCIAFPPARFAPDHAGREDGG